MNNSGMTRVHSNGCDWVESPNWHICFKTYGESTTWVSAPKITCDALTVPLGLVSDCKGPDSSIAWQDVHSTCSDQENSKWTWRVISDVTIPPGESHEYIIAKVLLLSQIPPHLTVIHLPVRVFVAACSKA